MQDKKERSNKWTPKYVEYLQLLAQDILSLNTKIRTEDGDETEIGYLIEDTLVPAPDDVIIVKDRRALLIKYISQYLKPREERVLRMRYGLDGDKPMTLEEVGQYFGVSRQRIEQIESKAIERLRKQFIKHGVKKGDI